MLKRVQRYLVHRRSFGYILRTEGHDLRAFARFLDRTAPGQPVSIKLALQWAEQGSVQPVTKAHRLSAIRGFARFWASLDPRTQVPPQHLIHYRERGCRPHIFSDAELRLILRRTRSLRPWHTDLRPVTYATLIGLLASSGLRPSEAVRLRDQDFDAATGTLQVPAVKRSPGRLLPLHPSAVRALEKYQRVRQARYPSSTHFFVGPFGRPLQMAAADWTFARLVSGIPSNGSWPRPRLYDLRHRFATKWITRWSVKSVPLAHHLVLLSRYLGHRHFHDTYWYVQPEISALKNAAARFERYRHQLSSP